MQVSVKLLLVTCITQLEEQLERQTSELRQQRAITNVLNAT